MTTCPYCGRPGADSRDHVMPRSRGVRLSYDVATNNRRVHVSCNNLREHAGECVGALACAFAVADTLDVGYSRRRLRRVRRVLKAWRLMGSGHLTNQGGAQACLPRIQYVEVMRVAYQQSRAAP